MTIAYLINQYPQTSQSFIRREIAALEARGLAVLRYTLRAHRGPLVDPADELERGRTRPVLGVGAPGRLAATLKAIARRPSAFARALALAVRVGRGSEVGVMEALALGRLVISAYVCGIPELVEPGVSGWLVPASSADALAAARHDVDIEAARLAGHFAEALGHPLPALPRTVPELVS